LGAANNDQRHGHDDWMTTAAGAPLPACKMSTDVNRAAAQLQDFNKFQHRRWRAGVTPAQTQNARLR